jgi:bacillithiol biosynthesis deacetylase BshB1
MILLAFGAHPDDVELAAAGTLLNAVQQGNEVVIVDLTRGELGTAGTPETRDEEASAAARLIGAERLCLGLPDTALARTDPVQRLAVVEVIRRMKPDLVLAPTGGDRHPDHIETHHLVRESIFRAGLANHEPEAGAPHRPGAVLYYPSSRESLGRPDLVVDVSRNLERKMAVLACYTSQFVRLAGDPATPLNEEGFLDRVRARAALAGLQVGVRHGEAFMSEQPLSAVDPFFVLDPRRASDDGRLGAKRTRSEASGRHARSGGAGR